MRLMLTAAVAALVASPLAADNHAADLETVLAADVRDDDRARDQYRNPAETLEFFQVAPGSWGKYWPALLPSCAALPLCAAPQKIARKTSLK